MRVVGRTASLSLASPGGSTSRYRVDRRDRRRWRCGVVPNDAWLKAALRHAAECRVYADGAEAIDRADDDFGVVIDRAPTDLCIATAGGDLEASVAAPLPHYWELLIIAAVLTFAVTYLGGSRSSVSLSSSFIVYLLLTILARTNRVSLCVANGRLRVAERWVPWRTRRIAVDDVLRVEEVRFERDSWSLALEVRGAGATARWMLVRTCLRRHADARDLVVAVRTALPAVETVTYRVVSGAAETVDDDLLHAAPRLGNSS